MHGVTSAQNRSMCQGHLTAITNTPPHQRSVGSAAGEAGSLDCFRSPRFLPSFDKITFDMWPPKLLPRRVEIHIKEICTCQAWKSNSRFHPYSISHMNLAVGSLATVAQKENKMDLVSM